MEAARKKSQQTSFPSRGEAKAISEGSLDCGNIKLKVIMM